MRELAAETSALYLKPTALRLEGHYADAADAYDALGMTVHAAVARVDAVEQGGDDAVAARRGAGAARTSRLPPRAGPAPPPRMNRGARARARDALIVVSGAATARLRQRRIRLGEIVWIRASAAALQF